MEDARQGLRFFIRPGEVSQVGRRNGDRRSITGRHASWRVCDGCLALVLVLIEVRKMDSNCRASEAAVLGSIAATRRASRSIVDFDDPRQEWWRLCSEVVGNVLPRARGSRWRHDGPRVPWRDAGRPLVVAPGLMVLGMILFMGKVSGAHLNPAVACVRPPPRLPVAAGAGIHPGGTDRCHLGRAVPARGDDVSAATGRTTRRLRLFVVGGRSGWNRSLPSDLVSVILGTASGAQNVGLFGALGVGAELRWPGCGEPIWVRR